MSCLNGLTTGAVPAPMPRSNGLAAGAVPAPMPCSNGLAADIRLSGSFEPDAGQVHLISQRALRPEQNDPRHCGKIDRES